MTDRMRPVVYLVVGLLCFEAFGLLMIATGVSNLGYDYEAYIRAASRVLDGAPVYDVSINVAGGFAIFLYPPPFALAVIPFAVLPHQIGLWQWEALAIGSLVTAIAILPVRTRIRWIMLGLSVVNWPVLYSILLGQVGALLLLIFAAGWRWRDKPWILGISIATGALVKVQPIILLGWAGLTGRWRAVTVCFGTLAVAAVVATIAFGPGVWGDYLALLGRVNTSVTTPNGFSLGAILYQSGVAEGMARSIQLIATGAVVLIAIVAILRASAEVSYLTTVVASQIVSPLVWDHYAIVLILPVAWLLEHGHRWAVGIMLVTSLPIVLFLPAAIYPVLFAIGLIGPLLVDLREQRRGSAPMVATARS